MNWPTGIVLESIAPGQSFLERVEELLERRVSPGEKMIDISAELIRKAPGFVTLVTTGPPADGADALPN